MSKKLTPKFPARIDNSGKLIPINSLLFNQFLLNMKNTTVEIVIKKFSDKNRSINQNNYYHGVVLLLLSNHLGYSPDELHEAFKVKFLNYREDKGLQLYKSTALLNTVEFEEYLTKIKQWAAEYLNFYIPDPHEINYEIR